LTKFLEKVSKNNVPQVTCEFLSDDLLCGFGLQDGMEIYFQPQSSDTLELLLENAGQSFEIIFRDGVFSEHPARLPIRIPPVSNASNGDPFQCLINFIDNTIGSNSYTEKIRGAHQFSDLVWARILF